MRGNKYLRRIVAALILTLLLMNSLGCTKNGTTTNSKNAVYTSAQNEFDFLVDAIKNKDKAKIKDKFSKYAVNNIDNFDEKLDRLINEFPGYEGNVEINDTFTRHNNYSKTTNIYTPSFDFVVNDDKYRMRIIYYVEADEDPTKLGWYSIQIYKRGDTSYSSKMYTHDVNDDPDILLWDYTKDE